MYTHIHSVGRTYSAYIIEIPFVSPFQYWARSDAPSSTCKFIVPPALKPKPNIETGMQGVYDTLNLCRIVSAYRIYIHTYYGLMFQFKPLAVLVSVAYVAV